MPITLEVKKPTTVPEGRQTATVSKLLERLEPYHYVDVFMKLDNLEIELKYGCPANVSENSKLGKLLEAAGWKLEVGTMVELEQALLGKRFSFMTMNEVTKDGTFARIVAGSMQAV